MASLYVGLAVFCRAQESAPATFGTTVVIPGGLVGQVYELPVNTQRLPRFEKLEPVGKIYTRTLCVPPREFREGFPV